MESTGNYELLVGKINVFIRKYYFNNFLRGVIFLGAGLFSAYVIVTLSEYFGNFSTLLRTLLFYFFIFLNAGLVCWLVIPPLLAWFKVGKTLTHNEAAEIIGKHFNDIDDKLINTLQLKKLAADDARHRELIEASIDQKIEALKPVSFPSAINLKENTRFLKWVIFPAAIICIIALAAPSVLKESTKRLIRHNDYFAPVAPFQFFILNQTLNVVQGEDLKLNLHLSGNRLPAEVYIETANNTFKLDKDNITRFHYLFTNLQQNTRFKLSANGFTSPAYEIKVNLRPALLHFEANLIYPHYLRKKNDIVLNAGDMTVPAGTTIQWHFHTQHASKVLFSMGRRSTGLLPNGPDSFQHSETVTGSQVYTVKPINTFVNTVDSGSYRVTAIADEAPSITVNERKDSVSMKALYFDGHIQDDHGFSALTFQYKVTSSGDKHVSKQYIKKVKADLSQPQSNYFYFWNLKDLDIKPGDQVTYFFEVADNDGVNGPKKTRSAERTLSIPDATELNKQLNAGTQAVKQKMQSAIKLAGQVEHDSQKLNQLLLNRNALSFDEKKQIAALLEKRKELNDLVKEIQDENKKNVYKRQENQQQDKQLTEKQKQMDDLLNSVLDPKTQELLEKLQQLLQQDQKDGTREELSKMENDNKSLKKELDRMLELYKKLEFEQKLNQNVDQLNQMAKKEEQLAEQARQPKADQQSLQKEQQDMNKDFQEVKKSLDELQKTNEQAEHKQDFENPKKEEQSIEEQMTKSAEELQKKNASKASKAQQQASKEMKQLAQKMQQNEQQGEETENNVNAQQLRELLKNLVNSSFEQERVMQALRNISPADPGYVSLAQSQKNIKDNLKTAEDSLYSLSRRIPQIQTAVNQEITGINSHIDQALENLGERRTPEANRNQQYAMTSMNNLALMLNEALDQLQKAKNKGNSGKGKGKQSSMSGLSKMQQQLNQNMQKAREQMQQQGNKRQSGKNGNISEQLAKLAREQQRIRQTLQQINRDENKDGTRGLGNLDKISKEMEQTEHDLVNRRITDESLKRQQQIQTRLLEAEKAEQQREQDQQRESHVGKDLPPGYIKALQDYQQLKQKQTEQVKTVSPELNYYYKSKIKSYFDLLNAK